MEQGATGGGDEKASPIAICECEACPDLSREMFSKCCQSIGKAKERCTQSGVACICASPKLQKLLDKVSWTQEVLKSIN